MCNKNRDGGGASNKCNIIINNTVSWKYTYPQLVKLLLEDPHSLKIYMNSICVNNGI